MWSKQGQSTLEFAVMTAAIAAALLSMQIYMKRGFQGRLRGAADSLGEQYSPRSGGGGMTIRQTGTTTTTSRLLLNQGARGIDVLETVTVIEPWDPQVTTRVGQERVGRLTDDPDHDLWD